MYSSFVSCARARAQLAARAPGSDALAATVVSQHGPDSGLTASASVQRVVCCCPRRAASWPRAAAQHGSTRGPWLSDPGGASAVPCGAPAGGAG